jgi:hydroxyacylglutathione hydrolase
MTDAAAAASPLQVALIPVLRDNYVFVAHNGRQALVVDPAVCEPVVEWLEQRQLTPVAVLHTHHHHDHIGGTAGLLRRWPDLAVLAAAEERERIPLQTDGLVDGDRRRWLGHEVVVLAVPGHTRSHLAFHVPATGREPGELFCGDALFGGGCGRLFEGTPEQMLHSLRRLAALPPDTRVWCAHEYTEANLLWAAECAPQDGAIGERLRQVRERRALGEPTLPSTIGLERATNLFVRAADAAELARLRQHKDHWVPLSPGPVG